MLSFKKFQDAEIDHRISQGWAVSGKFKHELCCKHYPLKQRIKLFDATVSATVLYGSGAWTMTKDREQKLKTNMRKMLRELLGCPRKVQEDGQMTETWVEWIARATHTVEEAMQSLGLKGWVEAQRLRKEQLADRIHCTSGNRWSKRVLHWQPEGGFRRVGRPRTKWSDYWKNGG